MGSLVRGQPLRSGPSSMPFFWMESGGAGGGDAVDCLERAGEVKLIVMPDHGADVTVGRRVFRHFCNELLSQRGGCEDSIPLVGSRRCEHHIQYLCTFMPTCPRRTRRA